MDSSDAAYRLAKRAQKTRVLSTFGLIVSCGFISYYLLPEKVLIFFLHALEQLHLQFLQVSTHHWRLIGSLTCVFAVVPLFGFLVRKDPVPFLIEMRRYRGGRINEFLAAELSRYVHTDVLGTYARRYAEACAWLFDGFNEIKGSFYESAVDEWRAWLSSDRPSFRIPVVLSSRRAERSVGILPTDIVATVLELDDLGITRFLSAYGSSDPLRDMELLERSNMLDAGGLARNPHWLQILVSTGIQMQNRGALFQGAAEQMVERELRKGRWERKAPPLRSAETPIPCTDELQMLGLAALYMQERKQVGGTVSEISSYLSGVLEQATKDWKPEEIIAEAEAATLMKRSDGDDRVDFTHQLLQEFFVAYALRFNEQLIIQRLNDSWWWNAALMLGGLVRSHSDFCRKICESESTSAGMALAMALLHTVEYVELSVEEDILTSVYKRLVLGLSNEQRSSFRELSKIVGPELASTVALLREKFLPNISVTNEIIALLAEMATGYSAEQLIKLFTIDTISNQAVNACIAIGEPAVMPLINALSSADDRVKQLSTKALIDLGDVAVPHLIGSLQIANISAATLGTYALGKIGSSQALAPLVDIIMKSPEDTLIASAIEALDVIHDPRAVDSLIAMLSHTSILTRESAIKALGSFADVRALDVLLFKLQNDSAATIRSELEATIIAIGKIPHLTALQGLITKLKISESRMWLRIATSIKENALILYDSGQAIAAINVLAHSLADDVSIVREASMSALIAIGHPTLSHLKQIVAAEERHHSIRAQVIRIHGAIAGVEEFAWVSEQWSRPEPDVRLAVFSVLGNWRDTRAVPFLISALDENGNAIGWSAVKSLGEIGGPEAMAAIKAALSDGNSSMRFRAVEILSMQDGESGLEVAISALNDEDEFVRMTAVNAIGRIGNAAVVATIKFILSDKSWLVRKVAAEICGAIGDESVLADLYTLQQDRDQLVREAATYSIREITARIQNSSILTLSSSTTS